MEAPFFHPGFRLTIYDKQEKPLHEENFSSEKKLDEFIFAYGRSKKGWTLLEGAFCIQRTKNNKDFFIDLISPSFVNFALKINHIALKILAVPFLLLVDLVTLPFRIVNLSKALKRKEEKHPLQEFLEKQGKEVSQEVLLKFEKEKVQLGDETLDEGETPIQTASQTKTTGKTTVQFSRAPGIKSYLEVSEENRKLMAYNKEWTEVVGAVSKTTKSTFEF